MNIFYHYKIYRLKYPSSFVTNHSLSHHPSKQCHCFLNSHLSMHLAPFILVCSSLKLDALDETLVIVGDRVGDWRVMLGAELNMKNWRSFSLDLIVIKSSTFSFIYWTSLIWFDFLGESCNVSFERHFLRVACHDERH